MTCVYILVFISYSLYVYLHLGKLAAPTDFEITLAGGILTILWVAPFSLEVSTPPSIFNYTFSDKFVTNSVIAIYPSECEHYNYLRDIFVTLVGSDGNGNTTMLDYNGAVEFTLFAVNGAGNGNATTNVLKTPPGQ